MDNTAVVIVLAVCAVALWIYLSRGARPEHFTGETGADAKADAPQTKEDGYAARLQTIRVFEMILDRKPTVEEIDTYSKAGNEQDILLKVLQDFKQPEKFENAPANSGASSAPPEQAAKEAVVASEKKEQFTTGDHDVLLTQLGRIQESVDLMKAAIHNAPAK